MANFANFSGSVTFEEEFERCSELISSPLKMKDEREVKGVKEDLLLPNGGRL